MKDVWVVEMRFSSIRRWHVRTPSADYVLFFLFSFLLPLLPLNRVVKLEETLLLTSVVLRYSWP